MLSNKVRIMAYHKHNTPRPQPPIQNDGWDLDIARLLGGALALKQPNAPLALLIARDAKYYIWLRLAEY